MAMEEGQEEAARAPGGAAGGASPFAAAPASIAAIDSESVARICSGQVVVDLAGAVKELVENSLDAKATHIEVKLKGSGLDSIEVADNGQGVSPKDYEGLALKHHTSKLTSFSDLTTVSSFGFRGEALSSICELAGSFEVSTRTAEEEVGTRLTFDRSGKLVKQDVSPRPVGTSVHIGELFSPLPVRRAEMARTIQRHKTKLLRLLQAYALVSVGVRITVTDRPQGRKGGTCRILATQSGSNLGQNVASIFGSKAVAALQPLNVDAGGGVRIEGMVSRAGEGVGRSDSDRQFTFVNGRPVDLSRALKALNEVWRHYEMKAKPSAVLDVKLPPGSFDVNVTPDKREVFITSELEIIDSLKAALHELWAPSRCTFKVNQASVQLPLTDFMQKTVMEKAEAALGGDGGGIEGDSLPASSSEDEADSDLIIPPMRSRSRVRTEQPSIEDVEDEVAAPISPPKSKTVASRGKRHTAREKPPSYSDDEDDGVIAVPGPRAPTLHVEKEAGEDGSQSTNSVDATDVKCVPPEVCSGALQESSIPVDGSGDALASAPSSASAKKPEEGNSSDHPPASSTVKGTEYVKAILPRAPDASSDSSAGKAKSKLLSFESMAFGASSRDAVASPCKSCSSSPSLAASPAAQMLPSLCSAGADLAARKRGQNRSHSGPSPQATKRRKAGIIAPPVPGSERVSAAFCSRHRVARPLLTTLAHTHLLYFCAGDRPGWC
jgi:DNA mismatch repair protein MutL